MNLLSALGGGFASVALFLICLTLVLLCRYAKIGYLFSKQEKKPQKPERAEPVYYLVERKKKAPKKNFSEPKEISFR